MKDDLLYIASNELEALLYRVEIPKSDDTLSSSINEDEDLYTILEGAIAEIGEQDDLESSSVETTQVDADYNISNPTSLGSVEEGANAGETDYLCMIMQEKSRKRSFPKGVC